MHLTIYEYLGNNKARLEYTSTPGRPSKAPGYVIRNDKADEFVKKYNNQAESLQKTTFGMMLGFGVLGLGHSIQRKSKLLTSVVKMSIGAFFGGMCGAAFAYQKKSKLLQSYNVEKF